MFFDVLEIAQKFHKLVDKNVVGAIVNALHACKINMTREKLGVVVSNVPLGYFLTAEEIEQISVDMQKEHKTVGSLIEDMKDPEYFRSIVRDKLTGVI